jgi:excisionase family DNA binding protein
MLETPKQCAARLGVISERTIRDLIRKREIEHVRIAGRVYLPEGAFERYVEERKIEPCRDGGTDQGCNGDLTGEPITSSGKSAAASASVRLAQQTANKLKKCSQSGSMSEAGNEAQVIRLRSS